MLQAANDLNIELSQSFMIGDSDNDLEAGKNAGVKDSIKIKADYIVLKDKISSILQ